MPMTPSPSFTADDLAKARSHVEGIIAVEGYEVVRYDPEQVKREMDGIIGNYDKLGKMDEGWNPRFIERTLASSNGAGTILGRSYGYKDKLEFSILPSDAAWDEVNYFITLHEIGHIQRVKGKSVEDCIIEGMQYMAYIGDHRQRIEFEANKWAIDNAIKVSPLMKWAGMGAFYSYKPSQSLAEQLSKLFDEAIALRPVLVGGKTNESQTEVEHQEHPQASASVEGLTDRQAD